MKTAHTLTRLCQQKGYITEDQMPWLQYTIEKRLSTLLIWIPLFLNGIYLVSPIVSFSFISSFLYLRKRTNGFHAKTLLGCFWGSIISETFFLGILFKRMQLWMAVLFLVTSSVIIFFFAPFNHPLMCFSSEEIKACAKSSRKRLFVLIVVVIIGYILNYKELSHSIILGITMTATMLVSAKITLRSQKNE